MRINLKKYFYTMVILIAALFFDILTKYLAVAHLTENERINFLGSFVQLMLMYNKGGLFSILQGYQTYFLIISFIVLALIVLFFVFEKNKTYLFCTALALITAGAIGNIIDRIAGRKGVADFIDIGIGKVIRYPGVFNIADACIVIGALILLIVFINQGKTKKTNNITRQ